MIPLTRLDRAEILVNADLILTVESTPDTLITFTTGSHLMVRESMEEIVTRVTAFRRRVLDGVSHAASLVAASGAAAGPPVPTGD